MQAARPAFGLSFTGRFGIIADKGHNSGELYIGEGSALAYRGNSVTAVGGLTTQASVLFAPGQVPVVTANAPVTVTAASAPGFLRISRESNVVVSLTATGSLGVPYRLRVNTNLAAGTWTVQSSGIVSSNPLVIQEFEAVGGRERYYQFDMH